MQSLLLIFYKKIITFNIIMTILFCVPFIISMNIFSIDMGGAITLLHQQMVSISNQINQKNMYPWNSRLQNLIDLKSETIRSLFLDESIDREAPKKQTLPIIINTATKTIQLVQAIVLWQDLDVKDFLDEKTTTPLVKIHRQYNQTIMEAMKKSDHKNSILLGGGLASCGYHVLKNILVISISIFNENYEKHIEAFKLLISIEGAQELFGTNVSRTMLAGKTTKAGSWRRMMLDQEGKDLDEVTMTINKKEVSGEPTDSAGTSKLNIPGDWLTQIGISYIFHENFQINFLKNFIHLEFISDQQEIKIDEIKTDGVYAFIINKNNMHWFCLVLNKIKNTYQYFIFDSKNVSRYTDKTVLDIIEKTANIQGSSLKISLPTKELTNEEKEEKKRLEAFEIVKNAKSTINNLILSKSIKKENIRSIIESDDKLTSALDITKIDKKQLIDEMMGPLHI